VLLELAVILLLLLPGPGWCGEDRSELLRVGTSGDYAPFSLRGEGFDIEVARRLAGDLGLRLEWVPFRWPELQAGIEAGAFDVAMSGVTWRPERAVLGWMSRAVASGGPCVLGNPAGKRVAVNRGGVLERFARGRFAAAQIRAIDQNTLLPQLLERGEVDAVVTDSFELPHFARPGQAVRCEPPIDRKVYWVAPQGAAALGPLIDLWIAENEAGLAQLRNEWFGAEQPRSEIDHLLDLIARRLALMPSVARWKRSRGVPTEDLEREALILAAAEREAARSGLAASGLRGFFEVQIRLAKQIQRRSVDGPPTLELGSQLRPALLRLGERITRSLAQLAPIDPAALSDQRLAVLEPLLEAAELQALRVALLAVRPEQ
jgi:cyclohexadienyl dehydratase